MSPDVISAILIVLNWIQKFIKINYIHNYQLLSEESLSELSDEEDESV